MLVLSRKENETIVIDTNIRVTILRCGNGRVRIGIQAPDEVSIKRSELIERELEPTDFPPIMAVGIDLLSHSGDYLGTVPSGAGHA
jgi:carbon storage regulator